MRLDKQDDGSYTLINTKENPAGLSSSKPLETKVAVLTEAEVVEMLASYGGSKKLQESVKSIREQMAAQADLQGQVAEQADLLTAKSAEIAALTADRDELSGRIAELTVQAQDADTENAKLKALLEDLTKPEPVTDGSH